MNELQVLTAVHRKLAAVKTLSEAKELGDQAAAIRKYVKATKQGLSTQNHAAYVKFLCERRAGELLLVVERSKGGGQRTSAKLAPVLAEAGIAETTARRWQALARYPDGKLLEHVALCNRDGTELTSVYITNQVQAYLDSLEPDEDPPEEKTEDSSEEEDEDPPEEETEDSLGEDGWKSHLLMHLSKAIALCDGQPNLRPMRLTMKRWIQKLG